MRTLLLSVATLIVLTGCAGLGVGNVYRAPSFQHQSSQLTSLSWQQLNGRSRISIQNPNAYSLPVQSLQAELWLDGEPWLQLDSPPIAGLAAGLSTTVELDWSVAVAGLVSRVSNAYDAGEVELTLQLAPTVDVPVLGPRQLQWQHDFVVPVPQLPKVQLADWRVRDASLTSLTLELDLLLDNPNRFGLDTGPVQLALRNGAAPISAVRLNALSLAADSQQKQSTQLTLNYGDLGLTIARALTGGGWPSNLGLSWSAPLRSPDLGLDLPSFNGEVAL
ncbi:LEA type 2 family protein [Saccharospirillum mangrovi]|uniref:NDR1/HIN1-like protein n=1 Tax=Saccharospirillum mangrovi TaxID=2161747 RepID=UPI000D398DD9|nr:LEA type 2 family protein [Saccharospirillum mangrovi]